MYIYIYLYMRVSGGFRWGLLRVRWVVVYPQRLTVSGRFCGRSAGNPSMNDQSLRNARAIFRKYSFA